MADDFTDETTVPKARARALKALRAVHHKDAACVEDFDESVLGDLITDLRHLADAHEADYIDGESVVENSNLHYNAEKDES